MTTTRSVLEHKQAFLRSLINLTPDQLAHQYQCVGEVGAEEEDHGRRAAAEHTLVMIEAIGKFLHGIDWEDANERAAAA